ncbi:MAG TPA: 4Fe-4S binding protein, partial [Planctomycetota bacterium]|nr:4Fe-4S binding protein [Planctomycetota bacterium]
MMPPNKAHLLLRRLLQGLVLAGFLVIFFWLAPPAPSVSQLDFQPAHPWAPVHMLGLIDPLAPLAAFLAGRALSILLFVPLVVVASSLIFPRVFCSHVCPLGTLIDVVGFAGAKRGGRSFPKLRFLKYALLATSVVLAAFGVGFAGFVTPMPILARGLRGSALLLERPGAPAVFWTGVLGGILLLALVRRRFWCNYLCPSGALLSLVSRFSLFKRVRTELCISCRRCVEVCDFDAIRDDDFTTTVDCTWCGACALVSPVRAIAYRPSVKPLEMRPSRRDFLKGSAAAAGLLAVGFPLGLMKTATRLRPPGALAGDEFRARCIRCGLCAQACPGPAIHILGIRAGLADYGTPFIDPLVAGCSSRCNNCGRVCPTGAITHHALGDKNRIILGTARYRADLCRPLNGDHTCPQYCAQTCAAAGH